MHQLHLHILLYLCYCMRPFSKTLLGAIFPLFHPLPRLIRILPVIDSPPLSLGHTNIFSITELGQHKGEIKKKNIFYAAYRNASQISIKKSTVYVCRSHTSHLFMYLIHAYNAMDNIVFVCISVVQYSYNSK